MTELATLGIKIEAGDIKAAVRELDRLESQSKQNTKQNKKLSQSFGGLKTVVGAFVGSLAVKKFVETAGAFESMSVSLETVTGSAERATMAMDGIKEFAKNTPFSVRELTDSFIKLKALGIEPTEEKLRSFGNTSSAMGKSLNQMIEAVADASTGEFERLKEFGIKASSQGDQVKFTFQGVTKTVKNSSKEITKYLEDIGKTKFAGAMEKQMSTINGKLSVLGDSFDNLIVTLAAEGGGKGTKTILDYLIDGVNWLSLGVSNLRILFANNFAFIEKMVLRVSFAHRYLKEEITGLFDSTEETAARRSALNDQYEREIDVINRAAEAYTEAEKKKQEASKGDINKAGAADSGAVDETFKFDDISGLDKLREQYATELELLQEKTINEQMLIDEAFISGEIRQEEHEQLMTRIAQEYADERTNIAKKESDEKKKATDSFWNNMINLMNSGSKTLFKIGKVAAIAKAAYEIPSAVMGAYKVGASQGGPWLGAAYAAAAGAAQISQLSAIQSASFGGGGGGGATQSGVTGGQPVTGTIPPGAEVPDLKKPSVQELRVTVEGDGPHSEGMRKFAENLAETIKDMGGVSNLVLT